MNFPKIKKKLFTENLLEWHAGHHRPLPWKGERNPYLIWLSEIILQQTRVEQGLPYFEKFKEKYPTVQALAAAPEDEVMKLWEGLGYYSRARNMHVAAKYIVSELDGVFPKNYEGIRALKGVGDYTASAIASFAFDLPFAVVDGNVYRVLARFFGIEEPTVTTEGKKLFTKLAQELLEEGQPGKYNQAIMDFGATWCTPAAPKCSTCPVKEYCTAFQKGMIDRLPVKSKRIERRQRFFNYLVINRGVAVFLKKRTGKDIWQNLYDFPLIETEKFADDRQVVFQHETWQKWLGKNDLKIVRVSPPFRQELTHQKVVAVFWEIEAGVDFKPMESAWIKVERKRMTDFAFPKIISLYLQDKFLPLELF